MLRKSRCQSNSRLHNLWRKRPWRAFQGNTKLIAWSFLGHLGSECGIKLIPSTRQRISHLTIAVLESIRVGDDFLTNSQISSHLIVQSHFFPHIAYLKLGIQNVWNHCGTQQWGRSNHLTKENTTIIIKIKASRT